MKTINLNKIVLLLIGMVVFTGCVQDDDFDTPDPTAMEPQLEGPVVTISSVAGQVAQAIADGDAYYVYEFAGASNYLEGYVISSDEGGNFFEQIIIQDKLENPTVGIKVLLDVNPLFTKYEVGRKIYIKLDGLSAGFANGVLSLGINSNNNVEKIPAFQEDTTILRSADVGEVVPLSIGISDFTIDKTNLFISLENVQFNRDDVLGDDPKTFASEEADDFDGERILESCSNSATTILSTSTFSDFKALLLPSNSGSISGVLTRDFFNEFFTVYLNSPEDINFDNAERCDPIELACGLAASAGTNNLFEDDFESQSTNSLISGNGWTNFIEAGTEGWVAYTQGGTNASQGISARVDSFGSGDASSVAWLITPQIDLDANTGVTFQFESSNSFSDGSTMQVLFSKDWDGTDGGIATATWGIVSDAYVTQDSDFFGDWFESGIVDLSCESGQIYIAFKYVGSGQADFDGTYELDFVSIDAE